MPVDVPTGVTSLHVRYDYDRPEPPGGELGNACDLGIFDERGIVDEPGAVPGAPGFRGWSGGARSEVVIGGDPTTPGYLPGPVRPGRWHVLLAPYHVARAACPTAST